MDLIKQRREVSRSCFESHKAEPTTEEWQQLAAKVIAACGGGDDENVAASLHELTTATLFSALQDVEHGLQKFEDDFQRRVQQIINNKAHHFVTSGNAIFRSEALKYLSRSEILLFKKLC